MLTDVCIFHIDQCAEVSPDPRHPYAFHYLKEEPMNVEALFAKKSNYQASYIRKIRKAGRLYLVLKDARIPHELLPVSEASLRPIPDKWCDNTVVALWNMAIEGSRLV